MVRVWLVPLYRKPGEEEMDVQAWMEQARLVLDRAEECPLIDSLEGVQKL